MQTVVTSLIEEHPTADLIDATKESIDQITKEITELHADFTKLNNEIWDATHPEEAQEGGLGTSHK